ncbi:MAG: hypothetical protein FJ009_19825 [Chloroflexi bacterium]|nr:hypothetical protein [Chloroflexota bacterium]
MKYAPVNVKLQEPTEIIPEWQEESQRWKNLNEIAGGNPLFFPLTIKAVYVIGIIHDLCESVSFLLRSPNVRQTTYIPAYGVFASGIDIFGRCIRGNDSPARGSTDDIKSGFKWLVSSAYENVPDTQVFIRTSTNQYTIETLVLLRHFAAHGQATSKGESNFPSIDYEILAMMPPLIASGLERYWRELQDSSTLCNRLAKANIIAFRDWPIFKSWHLFERNEFGEYESVERIFAKFDWSVITSSVH